MLKKWNKEAEQVCGTKMVNTLALDFKWNIKKSRSPFYAPLFHRLKPLHHNDTYSLKEQEEQEEQQI